MELFCLNFAYCSPFIGDGEGCGGLRVYLWGDNGGGRWFLLRDGGPMAPVSARLKGVAENGSGLRPSSLREAPIKRGTS